MTPHPDRYVIGVDFGTLTGRALVVRVSDGAELGTAERAYAHGVIDRALPSTGAELPLDWALQEPADYLDVLKHAVPDAVRDAGIDPADVIGVATDFTACTVLPVDAGGTPLCWIPGLGDRPHAYPKLWKHHAAQAQADRITALAHERGEPWIARYGGRISSEWQFAKALQVLEEDPEIYRRAERWIEAADWIVWQLCGKENRNLCTAGYKGMYQDGRWPDPGYLAALHPEFATLVTDKIAHPLSRLGSRAGGLTARAAEWTGLRAGIAVATGNVDAHVTAPAARAIAPGRLLMVMGTSTCHMLNGANLAEVRGMCGVVADGIIAGSWGYEAGQSGVGDIFGWFADSYLPASYRDEARRRGVDAHQLLSEKASAQAVGQHGLVALDWMNGNRSVLVDHELSGVIAGLTLSSAPEDVYRALVEATAFGTRTIIEEFGNAGVPVTDCVAAGGLLKNPFVMRVYADVCGKPLSTIGSAQGSALGAAIHAAVAAGAHPDVAAAASVMGRVASDVYRPDPANVRAYDALYREYRGLHDHFGRGGDDILHRLRRIRNEVARS